MPKTFGDAYVYGLRELLQRGSDAPPVLDSRSPASCFGKLNRPSQELICYSQHIDHPSPGLLYSKTKPINVAYCLGQLVWFLLGSDSLEQIQYYNSAAKDFSNDGETLCGSFGKRLFSYNNCTNQVANIVKLMKEDKSTRRAIAMILTPEDNQVMTKEFPCAIGVQYFLRDNRLHAVTFMRAQQALTVFPYDSILFSSAQAAIAHLLGAQVGRYVHCSGTYHFYDSERETAEKIVEEGVQEINLGSIDDYNAGLQHIGIVEQSLRSAVGRGGPGGAAVEKIAEEKIAGGEFFRTIADVLIFYAWCKLGSIEDALQSVREAPRGLSEVLATNVDRFVNR